MQILDDILENRSKPSEVSRMLIRLNSQQLPTYALNDILIAHPCPATVSRCSFRQVFFYSIKVTNSLYVVPKDYTSLVNSLNI